MDIEAFLLCDAANDSDGKLNILGGFNSILAEQVPAVRPVSVLACRFRFEAEEIGDHRFRVLITDMDGHNVISPIEGNMKVQLKADQISTVVNFILNIQNLKLEKFGSYRVELEYDGVEATTLPFSLMKVPSTK